MTQRVTCLTINNLWPGLRTWLPFVVGVLCGIVFFARLALVWLAPMSTLVGFTLDDGFYYFKIAANIVAGKGSSFDGVHTTDGYHPLWCWLLVGVFSVVDNADLRVRVALTLALGFGLIATWALYRILRPHFGTMVASLAAGLYGTSWSVFCDQITGQEFALFAFLLCLTVLVWNWGGKQLQNRPQNRLLPLVIMGGVIGLTTLARLDAILLLPVSFIILWRTLKHPFLTGFAYFLTVLSCSLVLLPYFVWKIPSTGHVTTVSGRIKVYWGQSKLSSLSGWERFKELAREMLLRDASEATKPVRDLISPILRRTGRARQAMTLLIAYTIWFVAAVGICAIVRQYVPGLHLLLLYGGLHYLAYGVWLLGNYQGYQTPEFLLLTLLTAVGTRHLWRHLSIKWQFVPTLVILITTLLNGIYSSHLLRHYAAGVHHNTHAARYQMALWMRQHLPNNVRVGAWNAGILGYFSERTVINLDGLVNTHEYFERYLKPNRVADYIRHARISYLGDYDLVVLEKVRADGLIGKVIYWRPQRDWTCFIVKVHHNDHPIQQHD